MQIGQISRNHIFVLLLILEIGLSVVFAMYYYVPKNAQITELQAEVEKKKRDVREIEFTKRELAETKVENERLEAEIEHLEKFFPEEMYISTVLLQIEHLATATRLDILRVQPGAGAKATQTAAAPEKTAPPKKPSVQPVEEEYEFNPEKEYRTAVVTMEISGNFSAIYNFFNELVSFPKLVVVNNFQLTSGQKDVKTEGIKKPPEAGAQLKITLPLTFYIQQKKSKVVL
ncbi:MAG: type 4a pilus biogenesis protein PilO [bacterium]